MFRAQLKQPLAIGEVPFGTRAYYEICAGEVSGERLSGTILSGGEWALIGSDGFLRVDVRAQIRTDDDALIYVQYYGLLEMNRKVIRAIGVEGETEFSDQYFYTNPRFETGDARYRWLNKTFFIGEGRITSGLGVEYRVWRPS